MGLADVPSPLAAALRAWGPLYGVLSHFAIHDGACKANQSCCRFLVWGNYGAWRMRAEALYTLPFSAGPQRVWFGRMAVVD